MMCSVPQLTSAVPEALESFARVSTSGAADVSAASIAALPALAALRARPEVGPVAAAGLECVGGAVPAHARRAADLGSDVAAVGAAFEVPEQWATLVPGAGGCPAVSMPVWVRDRDGQSLTEPLAAPMQLLCEPMADEERVVVPVALGAGGVVIVEARRRQPRRPPGERRLPMPPSLSPIWQNAEPFRGRTRRNERGQLLQWDYTHGDIEVFGPNRRHLGSADPITGEVIKPPEPGRRLRD